MPARSTNLAKMVQQTLAWLYNRNVKGLGSKVVLVLAFIILAVITVGARVMRWHYSAAWLQKGWIFGATGLVVFVALYLWDRWTS